MANAKVNLITYEAEKTLRNARLHYEISKFNLLQMSGKFYNDVNIENDEKTCSYKYIYR